MTSRRCCSSITRSITALREPKLGCRQFSVAHGDVTRLPPNVLKYITDNARLCQPDNVYVCDGSAAEAAQMRTLLSEQGILKPLRKYDNCWLARTDPADVARVESKTVISTSQKRDTIPIPVEGVEGTLGYWLSPQDMNSAFESRFPGCMKGRTMYVIPFSMGPFESPLSKIGVQLTDSPYVVASMGIMTRVGQRALDVLGTNGEFTKCLHSVGQPTSVKRKMVNNWPCNPEQTLIAHIPDRNEIASYGSGYGGNSLLGKKCFALRLGSIIARNEGWLAEHMLILGITNPSGQKKYIAAAFPSACGKTNMAMMTPTLPGFKVECVGDDIAWMRFDSEGRLRAINPEFGFFGVAPGTSMATNPNAMLSIRKNTLFTNVAETDDGGFFWEGLENETNKEVKITSWLGKEWKQSSGTKAAHPNSRFCAPLNQCPTLDANWESPQGVPIEAIIFGGRRPKGVPLVYEAFNWKHGVFLGAAMRSEATAAAEHKGKVIMNDPFAMRPFFGYNFGQYLSHWLSLERRAGLHLPKIFHVNWFRRDASERIMWPGFGENSRVLDWIVRRVDGEDCARPTAIGHVPREGSMNLEGLKERVDMDELLRVPKDFWFDEVADLRRYFHEQVNSDMPEEIMEELAALERRLMGGEVEERELVKNRL